MKEREPCTKEFLYRFSRDHADILEEYRDDLSEDAKEDTLSDVDDYDEKTITLALIDALNKIPAGKENATRYHNLMVGIVEFIFYPYLNYLTKQEYIHNKRKIIDITMRNASRSGIFHNLYISMGIPCGKVVFECKNYKSDITNPELDQCAGRLNMNYGMVGFICCRHFDNRKLFTE